MKTELYIQGMRLIEHAEFIKEHFIPISLQKYKFNIVTFEACLATELLLKGLICLSGHKYKKGHDINGLLYSLLDKTEAKIINIRFILNNKKEFPYRFYIDYFRTQLTIVKQLTGGQQLAVANCLLKYKTNGIISLYIKGKIEISGELISLELDNKRIILPYDSSLQEFGYLIGEFTVQQEFWDLWSLLSLWGNIKVK